MTKYGKRWNSIISLTLFPYFLSPEGLPNGIIWVYLSVICALQTVHYVTQTQHLIHGHIFAQVLMYWQPAKA